MANNNTVSSILPGQPEQDDQVLSEKDFQVSNDVLFVLRYMAVALAIPPTLCNIVIFLHKDMRSATAVYVIGLNVGQLVYVIGNTVQHVSLLTFPDPMNDRLYWGVSLYFGIYCGIVARRGAYVVMSLVSVERLYAIVRPLHVRGFLLSRRPLLCMSSAYVITAAWHVYILAKTEIRSVSTGSGTVYRPLPTQLYLDHKALNDAFSLAAKIVLTYGGLVTQLTLNMLTIFFLRRHNMATQRLKNTAAAAAEEDKGRQRERQMTLTMLAATLSYVVLSLPSALHHLVYTLYPAFNGLWGPYRRLHDLLGTASFVLSVCSCCVDFVCFTTLSSNYRATLLALLRLRRRVVGGGGGGGGGVGRDG